MVGSLESGVIRKRTAELAPKELSARDATQYEFESAKDHTIFRL